MQTELPVRVGLVVYDGLGRVTGGNLYDRCVADCLRAAGDTVDIVAVPRCGMPGVEAEAAAAALERRPAEGGWDVLLQDELCHAPLLAANRRLRGLYRCPVVALVHHFSSCEPAAGAETRRRERGYMLSVDAAVFTNRAARRFAGDVLGVRLPGVVALPGRDRLAAAVTNRGAPDAGVRPFRLLFVGTVMPRKGLHTLIDALKRLAGVPVLLDIVGDDGAYPEYVSSLRQRASLAGVADRIRFAGPVADAALARRYAGADLFVMPSDYEGLGIAYLEAMNCGLPVIAAAAGGAGEVVRDGKEGFLVNAGDPGSLADRIRLLAADRIRLAAMGAAAARRSAVLLTWRETGALVRSFLLRTAAGCRFSRR